MSRFDDFVKSAKDEDDVFGPPLTIPCAACDGKLLLTEFNIQKNYAFLICEGCGTCYGVDVIGLHKGE